MVRASFLALLLCWPSLARSQDFPRDFTEWAPLVDRPVFAGTGQDTWDKKIRERGWILKVGETYHLWYTGYNDDRSPLRLLGHATSADGLKWERDKRNPIFTKGWVEDMCVLQHEGKFLMFAEGEGDIAHALSSPDGVDWTEEGRLDVRKHDGTPISPGPYGTPTVWFEEGTWNLFYERGDQGVWLATSKDRKVWTNVQDEPVIAMGPQQYDLHAVALNQVFRRDGLYYGLYHANATKPWRDWSTCIARSRDLIHWEKAPVNPIIGQNRSSAILVPAPDGSDRLYTMHPDVRVYAKRRAE